MDASVGPSRADLIAYTRNRPYLNDRSVSLAGAAGLGGVWATACLLPDLESKPLASACVVMGAAALVAAAVLVAGESERRRAGTLLAVAGLLSPLSSLAGWTVGPGPILRGYGESTFWVVLAAAVLLYQHPRLGKREWAFIVFLAAHTIGGQTVVVALGMPEWLGFTADMRTWWPSSPRDRTAFDVLNQVLSALYPLDAVLFSALVLRRQRRIGALDRYSLAPVLTAVAIAAFCAAITWSAYGRTTIAVSMALLPLPVAFAYSALRLSRLRVRVIETITSAPEGPNALRNALREVLRDPTLEVRFWSPESGQWIDETGSSCRYGEVGEGRWRVPVSRGHGRVSAEIETVVASANTGRSVRTAVQLSGPAIENAGLRALVKTQLAASQRAHLRTVQAGRQQRLDLERDLHDGPQQRLHALLFLLARARLAATDRPVADLLLEQAACETTGVLEELRDLAHGLRPSTLQRSGLEVALREVVERLPLAVELCVPPTRYQGPTESAAYFIVCEALTNAVKHALADRAWVRVLHTQSPERTALEVEIRDDGIGGADLEGSGIRGMTDRAVALGGCFRLSSETGRGTRVVATLPDHYETDIYRTFDDERGPYTS